MMHTSVQLTMGIKEMLSEVSMHTEDSFLKEPWQA